jgi:hypothetical protein
MIYNPCKNNGFYGPQILLDCIKARIYLFYLFIFRFRVLGFHQDSALSSTRSPFWGRVRSRHGLTLSSNRVAFLPPRNPIFPKNRISWHNQSA